ncbi:hypothetical protein [Kribbella sp. NPDC004875]|uniref:hypothetical protein n=1 Tax=Kribbella sp. NPDC004875 TaxID=3364107 RepID=UPI0036CEC7EB
MNDQIQIPIAVLESVAQVLLAHARELEGEVVSVDKDYYWAIPTEQLYDVIHEPSDLTIGQLSECLERIDAIASDPASVTSYGLVWLAELMRAVGLTVVR